MLYDVEKKTVVGSAERRPSGLTGFISYDRLAKLLQKLGEIKPNEKLTHLTIDEQGFTLHLKLKQEA